MPLINKELICAQESGNPHDPYVIAIKIGSAVVWYMPRKTSVICLLFLQTRIITDIVTDGCQYSDD